MARGMIVHIFPCQMLSSSLTAEDTCTSEPLYTALSGLRYRTKLVSPMQGSVRFLVQCIANLGVNSFH